MNLRKLKKIARPGNVYVIIGTHTAFMSLGGFKRTKNGFEPISINGIDLKNKQLVYRCNGRVRLATKKEAAAYWSIMKQITNSLQPGKEIEFII